MAGEAREATIAQVRQNAERNVLGLREEVGVGDDLRFGPLDLEEARDHEVVKGLIVPDLV